MDNEDIKIPYKKDGEKTRLDLIPPELIDEVGKVLTHGAAIYGDRNWEYGGGMRWGRFYAAALRHLNAWQNGESLDPESGLSHLAHAACCIGFLIAYEARDCGEDDRLISTLG